MKYEPAKYESAILQRVEVPDAAGFQTMSVLADKIQEEENNG